VLCCVVLCCVLFCLGEVRGGVSKVNGADLEGADTRLQLEGELRCDSRSMSYSSMCHLACVCGSVIVYLTIGIALCDEY
jgi:hypothetical protein